MTFEKASSTFRLALGATALTLIGTAAAADQVILDDLIVDGSICAGLDCVNGESFGFDTLRLKENNLRIKAQDTSSSASFPTNDWQITFNESSNGGQNKFSIDDIDGGRIPFTIEAGAPSHSLYVDDGGRIGFGTSTPVVELHVKDGDTPTLRLEQDGSSGFTAQTWDVAGNETNFFVRDATNGSQLPFRIRPGADSNSLFIDVDDDVGINTSSPSARLHVSNEDASNDGLRVTNTGTNANLMRLEATNGTATGVGFIMDPSGGANFWQITATANENVFRINRSGGTGTEFEVNNLGNLTVSGSLFSAGGTCGGGCDRVFDADYELPSIEDHAALMWSEGFLPNVGPTPENAPINVSDKLGRMLNELEHAHIYIAQLNAELAAQRDEIEAQALYTLDQQKKIDVLTQRLDALAN